MRRVISIFVGLSPFLLFPQTASAHAFGKLYNLPVPFWMYLYGGAAAIIVSFLIIGYFFNKTQSSIIYPKANVSNIKVISILQQSWFVTVLKALCLFLFFLTIATGFSGNNYSYAKFNMPFFWIIFALGYSYLTAIIGNTWSILNPWKIQVSWFDSEKGILKYPQQIGYFPALIFYFLFIWIELFGNTTPFTLSLILIQYTFLNFFGVFLFGKKIWFTYCEFFSVFFRLLGKMSVFEYNRGKLYLRPPIVGLLKEKADHISLTLFVLFMLSSTAFDGFRATTPFYRLYWQNLDEAVRPILGDSSYTVYQTIGLLISPFVFLAAYLLFVWLAKVVTQSKLKLSNLALQFTFTLIPIAFVYNVAHYYTLLVTDGTGIINAISDPFGIGWNLFNTANWYTNFIPDANFVWHSQVALILLGHIAGVYLAHLVAMQVFPIHKKALVSQFPMLALMVIYTMVGLWILSQPITSGGL